MFTNANFVGHYLEMEQSVELGINNNLWCIQYMTSENTYYTVFFFVC